MKILVVAGASGGHIYPALAFLEKLQEEKDSAEALLVLPSRSINISCSPIKYKLVYITSIKLSFSLNHNNVAGLLSFLKGAWQGLCIILRFKPDIVVGFGSIDSVPLVMAAWFLRIKTLIHEQNVFPGRANRFLAKFADKVAVSFADSGRYFDLSKDKILFTGNPIRRSLKKMSKEEALSFLGLDKDKFTVLVMGGSQGSKRINDVFLKAVELIKERERLQVVHILGIRELSPQVMDAYRRLNIKAHVFDFCDAMGYVYNAADLAITRAGATSISELIYFGVPAILIPYPFAYAHQFYNAKTLKDVCAGVIIKDEETNPSLLKEVIEQFICHSERVAEMRNNLKRIFKDDAAGCLLKASESLLC